MARARVLLAGALLVTGLGGCPGKASVARSPEEAYGALLSACQAGDGALLFDALDTPTQWAIETVHGAQREMRRLILENYPAADRDAALQHLPQACEEDLERPRRYFRRLDDTAPTLEEIRRRLYLGTGQPVGSVRKQAGVAEVWREGGSVFHFYRDERGRWGFMEPRASWERAKEHALHELETVRENAALYRRRSAAAAGGPTGAGSLAGGTGAAVAAPPGSK